jgi:rRNA maturation endonuclease Nob1
MAKEQQLEFICDNCYAEFKINYNQDEDDFTIQDIKHCPFCGDELIKELDMESEEILDDPDTEQDWDDD